MPAASGISPRPASEVSQELGADVTASNLEPPPIHLAGGRVQADDAVDLDAHGETSFDDIPSMMKPLDLTLPTVDAIRDLRVVTREFPDGKGKFEVRHNTMLSRSLMSGFVENCSAAGTTRYEGTFINHPHDEQPMANGQGVRTNPDGSSYTGQWKDGKPHGSGEFKAAPPSCASYTGDWRCGKKHGFGVQRLANGDVYEGDWANGLYQDRGKYTYANGDEFVGIFEAGNRKEGTMYFTDGRVSTRKWQGATLVSCQDYDTQRGVYNPTITKSEVHDPQRNFYGTRGNMGMITTSGVRMN